MKMVFKEKTFRKSSLDRISVINGIIQEYTDQGFSLTLRQLYYQLVSRDIIPNNQKEYKKISDLVSDARRAGLVDWGAIVDRTRYLRQFIHYSEPGEAVRRAANGYSIDLMEDQKIYMEVWVEKDALVDVVGKACEQYDIPYFACRGYTSDSELFQAGRRMRFKHMDGKQVVLLHLGDHDPSGVDMSRDILTRLEMFGEMQGKIDFQRIALNRDQIERYNLPANPAKKTDSRVKAYVEQYGTESWELDALEPKTLKELIQDTIVKYLDMDKFRKREAEEAEGRELLIKVADNWDKLVV